MARGGLPHAINNQSKQILYNPSEKRGQRIFAVFDGKGTTKFINVQYLKNGILDKKNPRSV